MPNSVIIITTVWHSYFSVEKPERFLNDMLIHSLNLPNHAEEILTPNLGDVVGVVTVSQQLASEIDEFRS